MEVSVRELKSRLSEYLRKVSTGHEVRVTSHGKVVARLIAPGAVRHLRRRYACVTISDTWNAVRRLPESAMKGPESNDHARCVRQFDRDWDHFHTVAVTRELLLRAAILAETHGLRAYDSVHFAAAEAVHGASLGTVDFRVGVFDTKLARAMQSAGFSLLEA